MSRALEDIFITKTTFQKNEVVLSSFSSRSEIYLLKEGYVKKSVVNQSGVELTTRVIKPGLVFALAEPNKDSGVDFIYEALTDIEIKRIPRDKFFEIIGTKPELLQELSSLLIDQVVYLRERCFYNSTQDAFNKVAYLLFCLSEAYRSEKDHETAVEIPLTQKQLATHVGLTRESIGAQLKRFVQTGDITISENKIIVHNPKNLSSKYLNPPA